MANTSPWRWRRGAVGLGVLLAGLSAVVGAGTWATTDHLLAFGGVPTGERAARVERSAHFSGGHFVNAEATQMMKTGGLDAARQMLFPGAIQREPPCALPLFKDTAAVLATPPPSGLRVTWLGHSTTLIEIDGRVVLTDAMFSERASPSTAAGPRRFHPPPLSLEQLPHLDAVLISHDHYDHLDERSVQALAKTGVDFHVGLGVGAHLEAWGVGPEHIIEHEWWQGSELPGGVSVVSTPARHFSGRRGVGNDHTLWTSWAIIGPKHRVYFSGDTGQQQAFVDIGQKLGPFDVAMLEIGQYHPSWGDIHLGPLGALEAHRRLGAAHLIPIHWSTFVLGLHAWNEPPQTLVTAAAQAGASVFTPLLGEPIEPTAEPKTGPWWRVCDLPAAPGTSATTAAGP